MDATTLYRARRLLADDPGPGREIFDPLALLDLDGFVRNFLLYDQIVAIRNDVTTEWADMRPLNESMGEPVFVTVLPDGAPGPAVEELFHALFFRARDWVDQATSGRRESAVTAPQYAAWRASAQQIYGTVPDRRTEMRLIQEWGSVADYVARLMMKSDRAMTASVMWAAEEESQHRLIAEATVRAIFNTDLSRALGLSYSPAAARLPTVAAYDVGRAFSAVEALSALMSELQLERLEGLSRVHRQIDTVPVWAGVLLGRAGNVADLWPELVALRQETATLRAHRTALDRELNGTGEEQTLEDLRRSLRAESSSLLAALGGTGVVIALGVAASALTGGPWGFGFVAGLAAMLGAELFSDQPEKLRERLRQPRQIQVTHLGSQVRGLRSSIAKAGSLWEVPDETIKWHLEAHARMEKVGWL
jgi:hypothetical protein